VTSSYALVPGLTESRDPQASAQCWTKSTVVSIANLEIVKVSTSPLRAFFQFVVNSEGFSFHSTPRVLVQRPKAEHVHKTVIRAKSPAQRYICMAWGSHRNSHLEGH
jgi:hypothetical protein